jgi:hypothetical protein
MASTDKVNADNVYYNQVLNGYRQRSEKVDELRGRKVTYLSSEESRNKEWWNACRIYTAIALFIIIMLACVVVAMLAASGLLI